MEITEQKILNDPSASYWLKQQIIALNERDPVDALADSLLLLKLQNQKVKSATASTTAN